MSEQFEQPFLIWSWVLAHPVEIIGAMFALTVALFGLARTDRRAFERLKSLYTFGASPLMAAAIIFCFGYVSAGLSAFAEDLWRRALNANGESAPPLQAYEVMGIMRAYSYLQWAQFLLVAHGVVLMLFWITSAVFPKVGLKE